MTDEVPAPAARRWRVSYKLVDYNLACYERTSLCCCLIISSSSDAAEATVRALIPDAEDVTASPEEVFYDFEEETL